MTSGEVMFKYLKGKHKKPSKKEMKKVHDEIANMVINTINEICIDNELALEDKIELIKLFQNLL